MAPTRGEKMVSPVPTVTEAMSAPGPKAFTSVNHPPPTSRDGSGYENASATLCMMVLRLAV
jgi:hypothetical protein